MAAVPVLMVIYTSDAVEVRYSDGSRLELSPCGSVVRHHDKHNHQAHPLAGSRFIQQRTRFATSEFWDKVVNAIDFRNRFAERPYVCQELLHGDEVVSLYADIEQAAWPKDSEKANIEHLPDGGVRIFSLDEYASLVLSPHRQEFTVCYLSKLSQEAQKYHKRFSNTSKSGSANSSGNNECTLHQNSSSDGSLGCKSSVGPQKGDNSPLADKGCNRLGKCSDNNSVENRSFVVPEKGSDISPVANRGCKNQELSNNSPIKNKDSNNYSNDSSEGNNICVGESKNVSNSAGKNLECINPEKNPKNSSVEKDNTGKSQNCLQINPVENNRQVRGEIYSDLNRSFTDDEKLRVSPTNLVDSVCVTCRVSTPTDDLCDRFDSDAQVTPYGKTAVFRHGNLDQLPVHDLSSISKTSSEGLCMAIDIDATLEIQNKSLHNTDIICEFNEVNKQEIRGNASTKSEERNKNENTDQMRCNNLLTEGMEDKNIPKSIEKISCDFSSTEKIEGNSSLRCRGDNSGEDVTDGNRSKCRHLYCWVTRHFSCNECPLSWRHPLKLATEAVDNKPEIDGSQGPDVAPVFKPNKPRKIPVHIDKKTCVLTSLPQPLPLTCPFQHKHKWNVMDDSEIIQAGLLKVILIDGAVYRIIRMAAMNMIEVYPGDGSVFISQGISGHYFSYIRYTDKQMSEKTFSLKALPPSLPGATFSIEKLLKRASRFLSQATQSDNMASAVNPCWKKEEVKIVEPLPVVVLEECQIPGWGKFTAYTNGRVRIVFEDRTAMDLVCDFSKRISECVCHSSQSEDLLQKCEAAKCRKLISVTGLDSEFDRNTCRILLPSGKYVLVDLHKPGIYHKYVNQALEWASWVNSSPLERQKFYDQLRQPESVRLSAEAELKKITCFNYIIDNTGPKKNTIYQSVKTSPTRQQNFSPLSQVTASGQQNFSPPSQVTASGQQNFSPLSQVITSSQQNFSQTAGQQVTASQKHFIPPSQVIGNKETERTARITDQRGLQTGSHLVTGDVSQQWPQLTGNPRTFEMLQGFNSVRHALLQTNRLIKDIDEILEKNK